MDCTCVIGKPMCDDCRTFWRSYMDITEESETVPIEKEEC